MSERGHRGGRGGGGGRGSSEHHRGGGRGGGGHRGGGGGGEHGAQHSHGGGERPKKENILDLGKYMDKRITVKFNGGREGMCCFLSGVLQEILAGFGGMLRSYGIWG
jgi:U6 snRNA-associated Sm-like protein LSm7